MRSSSRRAKSRFFADNDAVAVPEPADPPRRSTRSRLARVSYKTNDSDNESAFDDGAASDLTFGSDIEDAIKTTTPSPPPAQGATRLILRKRKRTTTVSATTAKGTKKINGSVPVRSGVKTEITAEEEEAELGIAHTKAPKKASRPAAKPSAKGATAVTPPPGWEEMYAVAKEMRLRGAAANAAVDTMGCERLARPDASARDRRFHTLVALMLSSQTKDTVNAEAMRRLQTEMPACAEGKPPGLTLENMLAVDPAFLNELIGKVGFHNNKTKYLKQAAEILRDQHNSDIPTTIEGLMALPGVGPKMAHLCMAAENGWNRVEGIGVDVHVHRITNLWRWNATSTPEATRLALQSWLPRDRWREINWLLVGLGQTVCLPVGRRCGDCELGLRGLCPAADKKKVAEGKRRRSQHVVKAEKTSVVAVEGEEGTLDIKLESTTEEAALAEIHSVGGAGLESNGSPRTQAEEGTKRDMDHSRSSL
ncbi:hypothetical protein VTK73DRAFT_7546 [Phialemonium thermophilum]|uniref:Endonuclease III homolog n=1 Tax=Phialemonium thermophilum TaxID=223376 RepID=A0ABR3XSU5_9PEZI